MSLYNKSIALLGKHGRELLKGSLIAFSIKVVAAISSLIFNIYLARKIGAEQAGYFFLSLSIITIFSGISRLGLDNYVVKIIAFLNKEGRKSECFLLYSRIVFLVFFSGVIASLILFLTRDFIGLYIFKIDKVNETMLFMILATPFLSLSIIHAQFFQGFKKVGLSVTYLSLLIPSITLGLVILFNSTDSVSVAKSYLFTCACVGLSAIILSRFKLFNQIKKAQITKIKGVLKSSFPLLVVLLSSLILLWGGQIFLGIFSSPSDVTIYQVLHRTSYLISFILIAFNRMASPKISETYHNGDFNGLRSIISITNKSLFLITTALIIFVFIFISDITRLIGAEFKGHEPILLILCLGQYVNAISGSVGNLLMMTNNENLHMYGALTGLVVMATSSVVLIPNFGLIGAAIATACAIAIQNLMGVIFVKKSIGINVLEITFSKYLNYD